MDQAFLLPIIAWIILSLFVYFNSQINIFIKIILGIFLSLYIYLWWSELCLSLKSLWTGKIEIFLLTFQKSADFAFFSLFWVSPILLFLALSSKKNQNKTLWNLILFSSIILLAYLGTHL